MEIDSIIRAALQVAVAGVPLAVALIAPLIAFLLVIALQRTHAIFGVHVRLAVILILMIAGSSLSIALSGRSLLTADELIVNPYLASTISPLPYGRLASQISSVLIILFTASEIFAWVVRRLEDRRADERGLSNGVILLLLSLLLFFGFSVIISGAFGIYRDPELNDIYLPFVAIALVILSRGAISELWRVLRIALFLFSLASLIAAVVFPDLAVAKGFRQTVIPGIGFRLHGIADHANSLGFIAGIALLLEFSTYVRSRPNSIFLFLHGLVMVLSQSKTAWIAFTLGLAIVRFQWLRVDLMRGDSFKSAAVIMLIVITAVIFFIFGAVLIASSERVVSHLNDINIFSFTGRTGVWRIAWGEFLKSPLTGYGPSIWDPQFRAERGMFFAGQAHNQFMQVLGQAGLLGLLSMLLHLGMIFYFAFIYRKSDHGLALALVFMLLIRCWSESPLRMAGIIGWDSFIHLLAFMAVAGLTASSTRLKPLQVRHAPRPARRFA